MNIYNLNKTFTTSILFGLISFFLFSQNNETMFCGTSIDEEKLDYFSSFNSQIAKFENSFYAKKSSTGKSALKILTNSIPVKAHIIRSSNETGGLSISDLDGIINNLNNIYANAHLEFYLSGDINYINDDTLRHLNRENESELTTGNNVDNVINIYFLDYLENESNKSICGYADTLGKSDIVLIKNDCATNGSSLAHEIGHLFSLMHTHGPDNDVRTTELVNGSNCDTDGDGICDTPADPKLSSSNVNNDCEYVGNLRDANGDTYQPDSGNIMSYSSKSCRAHFSEQQMARIFAFYKVAKTHYSSASFNANFTANIEETCSSTLTVNFNGVCENATEWAWDIDGDNIVDYTSKNPSHTFETGVYNVSLSVSNGSNTINKTYFNFIKVGTLKAATFSEGFESFETASDLGWTTNNSTDSNYNWLINSGETGSEGTGPKTDYNSGTNNGSYIYAEASGADQGDIAEFISPCIEINQTNLELEFAYHMFGKNMGQLHVDVITDFGYYNDIIDVLEGQAQTNSDEDFLLKTIDLSSFNGQTIKIRFRAVRGKGWASDIAIDNIVLKENVLKSVIPAQSETMKVLAYPNPVKGNTLYIKSDNFSGTTNYRISNLVGQIFMEGIMYNNQIDLSKLNKGSYILTLQNGNSTVLKKIIK